MKNYYILFLCLGLSGCLVDGQCIALAEQLCMPHEGIRSIDSNSYVSNESAVTAIATCKDGTYIRKTVPR
jgi:hypothetical protein